MGFNKDYTHILYENPPQELLKDSLLAKEIIMKYTTLPNQVCYVLQFLDSIHPYLQSMKIKLGKRNRYYLQLSTLVAQISTYKTFIGLCHAQQADSWKTAWDITKVIDKLDMEVEFKKGPYKNLRKFIKAECRMIGILPPLPNYGLLYRIAVVLIGAIVGYTMSGYGLRRWEGVLLGTVNGCIMAGAHYIYTKK